MSKNWKKIENGIYTLFVDENPAATMEINHNSLSRPAKCTIGDAQYTIELTGFWKHNLEIKDQNQVVVLTLTLDKWYANTYTIDFEGNTYQFKARNNPMAEYVIKQGDKDILAYGLGTQNSRVALKITQVETPVSLLLDCLLWYQFLPIATENSGDTFTFLMMAVA